LEKLGIEVERFDSGHRKLQSILLALRYVASGFGKPAAMEEILRAGAARKQAAARIRAMARERGIHHVIHTGTLDLPDTENTGDLSHYLYCDHDWALALQHRPMLRDLPARVLDMYEKLEQQSLNTVEHVFTFSHYVRDHIVSHYGVHPSKVTVVGCGMGKIEPYYGPKEYNSGRLLFVAKHLFAAKGGILLDQAFRLAQKRRRDLTLTIVGDSRSRQLLQPHPAIELRDHLPWDELQRLFRQAALLVQPMLNDPWGQVYTEALISKTPVMGLNRNGLPEIIEYGRHGFLVNQATPEALADAIVAAVSDPVRLERMALTGQRHVMQSYSWDDVARRIALVPAGRPAAA
jgi:glycosyltransferase involved in cell wall biosynthesis